MPRQSTVYRYVDVRTLSSHLNHSCHSCEAELLEADADEDFEDESASIVPLPKISSLIGLLEAAHGRVE